MQMMIRCPRYIVTKHTNDHSCTQLHSIKSKSMCSINTAVHRLAYCIIPTDLLGICSKSLSKSMGFDIYRIEAE